MVPLATAQAHAPARKRILVIEDNADAASVLSQLLSLHGHEVHVASSGTEGVERARLLQPQAVLCDIGLPGLDGYGVARALRQDPGLRQVLLVALTGYASPEVREQVLAAGFDRHLVKPADAQQLYEVLDQGVPGRHLRQDS